MHDADYHIDKQLMRRAFNRVARHYDQAALLQHEVGKRMVARLDAVRLTPALILDAGAGTGLHTRALAQRYKGAHVIALDIAENMLLETRRQTPFWQRWIDRRQTLICADIDALPLRAGCADLIFSNLALQWCNDLDTTLLELRRALKPGGLLMFSSFGPDTLKELRASWAEVDTHSHVSRFIDMHDIGDALVRAHFNTPVMDVEHFTLTYPDVQRLMRDLKLIGAHNLTAGRARGLTGKGRLQDFSNVYERFRREGVLPASYEVVYGHAWAPETAPQEMSDGTVRVPLTHLGGRKPA